jgi:hypothetical protein
MPASNDARRAGQLSLDVHPHPQVAAAAAAGEPVYLQGALEAKIELAVPHDLNAGDKLLVTLAGEDGELLDRAYLEVRRIRFDPIEDKTLGVIGTTRVHLAKQAD